MSGPSICNVACCEEPAVARSMCAAHDAHYHPRPQADEAWRTTPYNDRPTSGDPHALATHASRARAVDDVFAGKAFAHSARTPSDALRFFHDPPVRRVWRPCKACAREIGSLPSAAKDRTWHDTPPGGQRRYSGGRRPTEGEELEHRETIRAIRERCLEAHVHAEQDEEVA